LTSIPYYQIHEFEANLGGQKIRVNTKPGIPSWDQITPATRLLAEITYRPSAEHILLCGCGHGALAVALARQNPDSSLWLMDINFISLRMAELTLKANGVSNARVCEQPGIKASQMGYFDTVVLELPKGRKLARRWLVEAYAALKVGGEFYLAGANREGIQPVVKDTGVLFGNTTLLGYRKGCRAVRAVKTAPDLPGADWANEPGIALATWYEFKVEIGNSIFKLLSLPGVFSYDRVDEGTELLLANMKIPPGARVLDVGCGYGILGLYAARFGAASVDMADVNLLAVSSAQENIILNNLPDAHAFPSDALSAIKDRQYDLVVTNPPFHSGKSVDYDIAQTFIADSWRVLVPGGRLVLVANKFIRYDRQMQSIFDQVEVLAETNKYHVLSGTKRT